ncbi:MAG: hypothetical protein ACK4TC_14555 [Sphingomonas pseudosanguinis]|uniref:hypothetical protein n=1 Tax=Sphingomonas pseudosanguinis TaxID=413712 RepID=UPI00391E0424
MPHTAYLPIIVDRYAAVVRHIFLFGLDLTGRDMRAQVRLYGDVPGPPLIDLLPVSNGNAQGLRLVEVSIDDAGVPTSHVEMVINETTMEGLPYAGEIGDVTTLAWDWQVTIAGRKRRLAKGEFQITGDGVTGAEVAPANRIQPYGIPPASRRRRMVVRPHDFRRRASDRRNRWRGPDRTVRQEGR